MLSTSIVERLASKQTPYPSSQNSNVSTIVRFESLRIKMTLNQLKHRLRSCTTGNIALGRGLEVNQALGFASCFIRPSTTPFLREILPSGVVSRLIKHSASPRALFAPRPRPRAIPCDRLQVSRERALYSFVREFEETRTNFIWREFNLAIFYDSPNRQIKVLAEFSSYTVFPVVHSLRCFN